MAWRCISPWSSIGRFKEDVKWIFFIYVSRLPLSEVKSTKTKNNNNNKKKRKPWLNARKHWESESINCNLSAAVLHVKPSCNNSNLNDIGISLQRADSGSYHFLVTGPKIFRIIWKLSENWKMNVFQVLFSTTRFSSVLSCEDLLISFLHRSANIWISYI